MISPFSHSRPIVTAAVAASLLMACPALAGIDASFDDGNTDQSSDGFPGTAGDGWLNSWLTRTNSRTTFISGPTVDDTQPLHDDTGNYLSATLGLAAGQTGGVTGVVTRNYEKVHDGFDADAVHIVHFLFRPDSFTSNTVFMIFERGGSPISTDSATIWQIRGNQANGWMVYDGNRNGGIREEIKTGIDLAAGRTYAFTVTVDPTQQSYQVAISDGVQQPYTSPELGFRSSATSVGQGVHFGGSDSDGDTFSFSLDEVSFVPEPVSAVLIGFGGLALFMRR
ncbi:MAG TPA: hypothetical protein VF184_13235 [Phycisphaeraceae bacterium]